MQRRTQRKTRRLVTVDVDMSTYIPDDIMVEILARLPMKTILCCRFVCKSWNLLTRSKDFVDLQRRISNSEPPCLVMQAKDRKGGDALYLFDAQESIVKDIGFPKIQLEHLGDLEIKCSCDGLLCLALRFRSDPIFIFNPITKEGVVLPSLDLEEKLAICYQFGLGFDCLSRKYKLVREYQTKGSRDSIFEIFTLGERSWRKLSGVPQNITAFGNIVEWNGSLYCLVGDTKNVNYRIIAFDLSNEECYIISDSYSSKFGGRGTHSHLSVLGESLVLVDQYFVENTLVIKKVTGDKTKGFYLSVEATYLADVHMARYHSPLMGLDHYILLLKADDHYGCSKDERSESILEWLDRRTGEFMRLEVKDLPENFDALQFRPTFINPIAFCN